MLRASAEHILFTNIYGALPPDNEVTSSSSSSFSVNNEQPRQQPMASLVEVDGTVILLDCGWNMEFSQKFLALLHPHLKRVDCVLLSNPDLLYCGALPFVLQHLRRGVPVIAPSTLAKVATYNVLSQFMSRFPNHAVFSIPMATPEDGVVTYSRELHYEVTVDDIFNAFRCVKEPYGNKTVIHRLASQVAKALKHRAPRHDGGNGNETVSFDASAFDENGDLADVVPPEEGGSSGTTNDTNDEEHTELIAEPIGNGRVIGAYMWRLTYRSDDILYCPDFSVNPSCLLRRCPIPSRSTLALCGIGGFDMKASSSSATSTSTSPSDVTAAEATLTRSIIDTLRREKDVLLPMTMAGRGMEWLMHIQRLLADKGVVQYNVVLAHYQAKELLARIRTMTELLVDGLVYGDHDAFANVIPCRTVEEVYSVPSPKLVFADGQSLDTHLSAELLPTFLRNGANLIVVVPPAVGEVTTNAGRLEKLVHPSGRIPDGGFSFSFLKRSRLSKVELEQYYVELEERESRERRRLQMQEAEMHRNEWMKQHHADEDLDDTVLDDDDAEELGGAAFCNTREYGERQKQQQQHTAASALSKPLTTDQATHAAAITASGTYFPSAARSLLPAQGTKHLVFPPLESKRQLSSFVHEQLQLLAQKQKQPEDALAATLAHYGIPLSPQEVHFIRRTAPMRIINDDAPLDVVVAINDAQVDANIPCKITKESVSLPSCSASVAVLSLAVFEGCNTAAAIKHIIGSQMATTKRFVPLRCSQGDAQACAQWLHAERRLLHQQHQHSLSLTSREDEAHNIVVFAWAGQQVQLAMPVYSVEVELDSALTGVVQASLRGAKETRSNGYWEVGVLRAMASARRLVSATSEIDDDDSVAPVAKKHRTEDVLDAPSGIPLLIIPPPSASASATATSAVDDVPVGSVFVGAVELPTLRDYLRTELRQRADVAKSMLVLEGGAGCIRKSQRGGGVTVTCVASESMYELRDAVYAQFQQSL